MRETNQPSPRNQLSVMETNKRYFIVKVIKGYNEGGIPKSLDNHDVFETYNTALKYMAMYAYGDDVHDYEICACEPKDTRYLHIITMEHLAKHVDEMCPYCEHEVELGAIFAPQKCPVCGKWICPCNMCDHEVCDCNNCPVQKLCHNRNLGEFGEGYDIVCNAEEFENKNDNTKMEVLTEEITETLNESNNPLPTRLVCYINKKFNADKAMEVTEKDKLEYNVLHDDVHGSVMNALVRNNANNALTALKSFMDIAENENASDTLKSLAKRCIVRFVACMTFIERDKRFTNVMPQNTHYIDDNGLLQVGEYDSATNTIVAYYDGQPDIEFQFSARTIKESVFNEIAIETNFIRLELQEMITDALIKYLGPIQAESNTIVKYLKH